MCALWTYQDSHPKTLENKRTESLSTACDKLFLWFTDSRREVLQTDLTNVHSKAEAFYKIKHFSKRYSPNILPWLHMQTHKMVLTKTNKQTNPTYFLVHKNKQTNPKLHILPRIPLPKTMCSNSGSPCTKHQIGIHWKEAAQPENT